MIMIPTTKKSTVLFLKIYPCVFYNETVFITYVCSTKVHKISRFFVFSSETLLVLAACGPSSPNCQFMTTLEGK